MTNIFVTDMNTARSQHYASADRIISLLDPDLSGVWPVRGDGSHLCLHFDDIDGQRVGQIPPGRADVRRILEFGRALPDDGQCLIHCHAGVSRSTAAAIAVLVARGHAAETAFEEIRAMRGDLFWPNQLITEMADQELGQAGRLSALVLDWKLSQRPALEQRGDGNAIVFLARLIDVMRTRSRLAPVRKPI